MFAGASGRIWAVVQRPTGASGELAASFIADDGFAGTGIQFWGVADGLGVAPGGFFVHLGEVLDAARELVELCFGHHIWELGTARSCGARADSRARSSTIAQAQPIAVADHLQAFGIGAAGLLQEGGGEVRIHAFDVGGHCQTGGTGADNHHIVHRGRCRSTDAQRHAPADEGWYIKILAFVERGFAFVEAALGNHIERKLRMNGAVFLAAPAP